jgi:hypothetical protein
MAPPFDGFVEELEPFDDAAFSFDEEDVEEPNEDDIFWGLRKGSSFISAVKDKEDDFFDGMERLGFTAMWKVQFSQYYGQTLGSVGGVVGSHTIGSSGEDGEQLIFRLNESRSIISQALQLTIGERASFQCLATNDDYEATSQVEACDQLIDYCYRETHGERKEREVFEGDANFGNAFAWLQWDPEAGDDITHDTPADPSTGLIMQKTTEPSGAPSLTVVYPWENVREISAKDHIWSCVRSRRSKWDLVARFPEHAEKLRAMEGLDDLTTESLFGMEDQTNDSDDVIVRHFYLARCAAAPTGRHVVFVDDIILIDEDAPVSKGLPLVEMCSERYIGTSFGYAPAWMLNPANQAYDQLLCDTLSNLAVYGRQVIAIPEGTTFDIKALANGHRALKIPVGAEMPQPLLFASMPEPVKWVLEFLLRRMEGLSGVNSVTRGDPQSNITSGSMAALFHEISVEYMGSRQVARDFYREGVANMMLDLMRMHGKTAFVAQVIGKSDRPYIKQFSLEEIAGVRRVIVKTRNPMMSTTGGRMDIFNAVKGIANPEDRAAAIDLLLTGNTDKFTDYDSTEGEAIDWENESLADGLAPVVSAMDDHKRHWRAHKAAFNKNREAFMGGAEGVEMGPARQAFLNHMLAHVQVYSEQMHPVMAEWNEMEPPPMFRGGPGPQPQPSNMAPQGAMGGGKAGGGGASVTGRAPSGPVQNSGTDMPEAANAAQSPSGPAQDQGEAA